MHARFIHNDRLVDALHMQAGAAILHDPGVRSYYEELRGREIGHNAALRQVGNRLVGILHGCLKTTSAYNETTAWSHRPKTGACAGARTDHACRVCGSAGDLHSRRTCAQCVLTERLHTFIPTQAPNHRQFQPLVISLAAAPKPRSVISWLSASPVPPLLLGGCCAAPAADHAPAPTPRPPPTASATR